MAETTIKFSPKEAIKYGWQTVKKNLLFFVVITVIYIAAALIQPIFEALMEGKQHAEVYKSIFSIFSNIFLFAIELGLIFIFLSTIDGKSSKVSDVFKKFNFILILKYIASSIIFFLIFLVGLLLLVVPGIIFAIRFSLYPYILVDKNVGPIEALKESWRITKGNALRILVFNIYALGITILGLLALVVGLLVAIPITNIGLAYIYRKLSGSSQEAKQA
jgi:uncharacterized membrane protein